MGDCSTACSTRWFDVGGHCCWRYVFRLTLTAACSSHMRAWWVFEVEASMQRCRHFGGTFPDSLVALLVPKVNPARLLMGNGSPSCCSISCLYLYLAKQYLWLRAWLCRGLLSFFAVIMASRFSRRSSASICTTFMFRI